MFFMSPERETKKQQRAVLLSRNEDRQSPKQAGKLWSKGHSLLADILTATYVVQIDGSKERDEEIHSAIHFFVGSF